MLAEEPELVRGRALGPAPLGAASLAARSVAIAGAARSLAFARATGRSVTTTGLAAGSGWALGATGSAGAISSGRLGRHGSSS